jgi:hypothetical protein
MKKTGPSRLCRLRREPRPGPTATGNITPTPISAMHGTVQGLVYESRREQAKTRLFHEASGGVEDDVQGSHLLRLGVSVHQESLAILSNIIREQIC